MRSARTIQKRTEPTLIEPMQCKPVTALLSEKCTFEIKFDGYLRRPQHSLFDPDQW